MTGLQKQTQSAVIYPQLKNGWKLRKTTKMKEISKYHMKSLNPQATVFNYFYLFIKTKLSY